MEALFDSSSREPAPSHAGGEAPMRRAASLLAENLRLKDIITQQQKQLDAMKGHKGIQVLQRNRSLEPTQRDKLSHVGSLEPTQHDKLSHVAQEGGPAHDKLLLGVLALAEHFCLCTASQIHMMLGYVQTGRFKAQYYVDMWSKRLQSHSPNAAAQLNNLLEGRNILPDAESLRRNLGRARPHTPKEQEMPTQKVKSEPVKSEPDEVWTDAPRELVRRATRTFKDEDESHASEGAWRAVGSGLVELTGSKLGFSESPFRLKQELYDRLRPYQRSGVAWMAKLYQAGHGGILADDMGLGKTVQAYALINGVREVGATHVMILLPVTLLEQWEDEAEKWCPGCPVYTYHGSASQRARALRGIMQNRGGVLLTSYSVLKNSADELLQVEISESLEEISTLGCVPKRQRCAEDSSHPSNKRQTQISPASNPAQTPVRKPWDLVLCDEAHVMRTISTLLGRTVRNIRAHCRVLLTGTPVQNSLQDLWALMDFAQPQLLGNHVCFVKNFSNPIDKGSVSDASPYAVELKRHLCEQLWSLVKPHMLRRTKESVGLLPGGNSTSQGADPEMMSTPSVLHGIAKAPLPPKTETVVWLTPAKEQVDVYKKLLAKSDVVKEATEKQSYFEVFNALALLKRLCNHPSLGLPFKVPGSWQDFLMDAAGVAAKRSSTGKRKAIDTTPAQSGDATVTEEGCEGVKVGGEAELQEEEDIRAGRAVEMMLRKLPNDLASLVSQSAKLRCLQKMLPALASRGHRTLIFLQGVKMMDLVEICIMKPLGLSYLRLDGQVSVQSRAERVRCFQSQEENIQFMLLTTRVGGYGLNLTAADRVIIVDPNWNPAVDAQAVDRAYRIGQKQQVKVYRLVMSGLVEDKIFRLQVFKMGLTKTALDAKQQQRYFTSDEIRGLFEWADPAQGGTRKMLLDKHGDSSEAAVNLSAQQDGAEEGWLAAGPVAGLSDFSLLYSTLASEEETEGACEVKMTAMKDQLGKADLQMNQTSENRQALEERIKSAHVGMADAAQKIALATADRLKAVEMLKQKQCQLKEARRQEAATEQRLEKTMRARALASEQVLSAEQAHLQAEQGSNSAIKAVKEASEATLTAEAELFRAVAGVQEAFSMFAEDGKAINGGVLESTAGKLRTAQRTFDRFCKASEGVQACRSAWQDSEDVLASSCTDKERTKAEALRDKTRQRLETGCENTAQVAAALQEAVATFTDSLCAARDQQISVSRTKSAQQAVKSAFRQASSSWHKVKQAIEMWMKATLLQSRSLQKACTTAAALAEVRVRLESAEQEHKEALATEETCRATRAALTKDVAAADAAHHAAEVEEISQKRRKAECKSIYGSARESLRPARAAEKQAAAERTALLNHYSKSERGQITEELAASKSSAKDARAAVEALKGEAYDANQVEEAYQAKKKQKVDVPEEI